MENISKALYMAAAILISIMILSIFVIVFRDGSRFGEKYDLKQNLGQLELFNSRFEAYNRNNNTISDIISITNLANDTNNNSSYNKELSVTIDIEIDNVCFSITPDYNIERNYVYVGKSESITATSYKMYLYDLMDVKKENLKKYCESPPIKTDKDLNIAWGAFENGDILSKVNNEMDYKYYFKCDTIEYSNSELEETGRVNYMHFTMYKNPDYV